MKLVAHDLEVDVRPGTIADVPLLLSFFQAMAAFEKLPLTATEDSLRASLFGDDPAARTLLAFAGGQPIAYVVYYFTFGTMVGKRGLWLEDLFIDPAFRKKGIGRVLMAYLADIAVKQQCGRFEWSVLDWNENAIEFYKALGANPLGSWRIFRLEESELPRVAGLLTPAGQVGLKADAT
jgi:GNAT superfamily N-acetyltransferase